MCVINSIARTLSTHTNKVAIFIDKNYYHIFAILHTNTRTPENIVKNLISATSITVAMKPVTKCKHY